MHSQVRLSRNLRQVIWYHERKVKLGRAECLYAGNMLKDADELTREEKQWHLQRLSVLNERVERKTLQVFLSWTKEDMRDMKLADQPYLLYRHLDATHPHAHIVTTNIRRDGTKISFWREEMWHSMQLSRELEVKYGLVRAGKRLSDEEWARRHPVQKVVYGVTPLKPTINAVIEHVVPHYAYTTLDELNALLRPYRLRATQGREESVTRRNNGLLFFPLNAQGEAEPVYIKASDLRLRPTIKRLEERFTENRLLREEHRLRLTTAIDWVLYRQSVSKEALRQALQKERISLVEDLGQRGGPRQVYYIDELAKTVFDGRALGKAYSAEGLDARCLTPEESRLREVQRQSQKQQQKQRLRLRPGMDDY